MIVSIFVLLCLILVIMLASLVLAFLAWQKVSIYLTFNTRYDSVAYEKAVTGPMMKRPKLSPRKTEKQGRQVKEVADLIDITEVSFEEGYKALVEIGE